MPRNQNRFGTQPTAAPAPATRGRGAANNRGGGGNRNRGGGTKAKKLPNAPLYGGKAGQAAANKDPDAFIRAMLEESGMTDFSGTPYVDWSNDALPASLRSAYDAANAQNQRLGVSQWAKQTYGAGWGKGKKGNFSAGNLSAAAAPLGEQYVDYQSNVDPLSFLTTRATGQGGFVPGGGNQDFQTAYQLEFVPQLQAELETARSRTGNPQLSMDDFVAGRDLANEARRWYATRPSNRRQTGPISPAGRFSWWE